MGIPFIDAPGEAEAQCAELVKGNKVYAAVTEDSDALAFGDKIIKIKFIIKYCILGSSIVLPHLTISDTKKIKEIHLTDVLKG